MSVVMLNRGLSDRTLTKIWVWSKPISKLGLKKTYIVNIREFSGVPSTRKSTLYTSNV